MSSTHDIIFSHDVISSHDVIPSHDVISSHDVIFFHIPCSPLKLSHIISSCRLFQVNPASCEFTDDGVAVVGTVVFEMPGGKDAPVKSCFGSSLMTLRVLYPNRKAAVERHKEVQPAQRTTQT